MDARKAHRSPGRWIGTDPQLLRRSELSPRQSAIIDISQRPAARIERDVAWVKGGKLFRVLRRIDVLHPAAIIGVAAPQIDRAIVREIHGGVRAGVDAEGQQVARGPIPAKGCAADHRERVDPGNVMTAIAKDRPPIGAEGQLDPVVGRQARPAEDHLRALVVKALKQGAARRFRDLPVPRQQRSRRRQGRERRRGGDLAGIRRPGKRDKALSVGVGEAGQAERNDDDQQSAGSGGGRTDDPALPRPALPESVEIEAGQRRHQPRHFAPALAATRGRCEVGRQGNIAHFLPVGGQRRREANILAVARIGIACDDGRKDRAIGVRRSKIANFLADIGRPDSIRAAHDDQRLGFVKPLVESFANRRTHAQLGHIDEESSQPAAAAHPILQVGDGDPERQPESLELVLQPERVLPVGSGIGDEGSISQIPPRKSRRRPCALQRLFVRRHHHLGACFTF